MINGLHVVIYSTDAEKDREFFKNVLKFPNVDVGDGWLIFAAPPAEMAFHPATEGSKQEAYLMCDDVEAQVESLTEAGCACAPIVDEGWGLRTSFTLPGGGAIGLYEARHDRPPQGN